MSVHGGTFKMAMVRMKRGHAPDMPIGSERWNVQERRNYWDGKIQDVKDTELGKINRFSDFTHLTGGQLKERISFYMVWAHPKLSSHFTGLVCEYCDHLLSLMGHSPWPKLSQLEAFLAKYNNADSDFQKTARDLGALLGRMKELATRKERGTVAGLDVIETKTREFSIRRDGAVRWRATKNVGVKDRYWSPWYLASMGMHDELVRLLDDHPEWVDMRDPDHGYTALHYVVKMGPVNTDPNPKKAGTGTCDTLTMVKLLLARGADVNARMPDSRTPLHLAAAYGTRPVLLELLAVGADYEALDEFGCSSLELARQNGNRQTVEPLFNWSRLAPPLPEEEQEEEDLSGVPAELLDTPDEVRSRMSPSLRIITTRLDGHMGEARTHGAGRGGNGNCGGSGNDVSAAAGSVDVLFTRMRLCEKHAFMCRAEESTHMSLHNESIKSTKRRWWLAKHEHARTHAPEEKECGAEVVGRLMRESVNAVSLSLTLSLLQSDDNDRSHHLSNHHHDDVGVDGGGSINGALDGRSVLSAMESEGGALDAPSVLSAWSYRDDFEAVAAAGRHGAGNTTDMDVLVGRREHHEHDRPNRHATRLLAHELASSLVGHYMAHGAGVAERHLDCCRIEGEPSRSRLGPNAVMDAGRDLAEVHCADGQPGCAAATLRDVLRTVRVAHGGEGSATARVGCQARLVEVLLTLADALERKGRVCRVTTTTWIPRLEPPLHTHLTPAQLERAVEDVNDPSIEYEGRGGDDGAVRLRRRSILVEGGALLDAALDSLARLHERDIVEPCTIAPLLELRSAVQERLKRHTDAMESIERAVGIAERTLGVTDEETLRLLSEALRLRVKYASHLGYSNTNRMATDLSKKLDILGHRDPEAAQRLATQCSQLLSITTLLEHGQMEVHPGVDLTPSAPMDGRGSLVGRSALRHIKKHTAATAASSAASAPSGGGGGGSVSLVRDSRDVVYMSRGTGNPLQRGLGAGSSGGAGAGRSSARGGAEATRQKSRTGGSAAAAAAAAGGGESVLSPPMTRVRTRREQQQQREGRGGCSASASKVRGMGVPPAGGFRKGSALEGALSVAEAGDAA